MTHYIGERFGRLSVLSFHHRDKYKVFVLCHCDCGTEKIISTSDLKSGRTRSCGCLRAEMQTTRTKNKIKNKKLEWVYQSMKIRCNNPKNKQYKNYGGRGIKVCDEWNDKWGFRKFEKWALENGYKDGLSLDRINNNKGYSPENCRWTDLFAQANNRRTNRTFDINGSILTLKQIADMYKLNYFSLRSRIHLGWNIHKALSIPFHKRNKR